MVVFLRQLKTSAALGAQVASMKQKIRHLVAPF